MGTLKEIYSVVDSLKSLSVIGGACVVQLKKLTVIGIESVNCSEEILYKEEQS